jgi:hypothetical protein
LFKRHKEKTADRVEADLLIIDIMITDSIKSRGFWFGVEEVEDNAGFVVHGKSVPTL